MFAEAVDVHSPVALLFGRVVTKIVLACEYDVLAVLAHIVSIAVDLVRIFTVGLVGTECYLVHVRGVFEQIAGRALSRIAPIAVFLGLVPYESGRTFGLKVNARQTVVVDVTPDRIAVDAVTSFHAKQRCVRANRDQSTTGALHIARPIATFGLEIPEKLVWTLADIVRA